MNPPREETWAPSPELLAAYFDGEFEGRDELIPMRRRLEDWLARNPEARAEFTQCRRLKQLWLETTPPDPGQTAWRNVLDEIEKKKDEAGRIKDEQSKVASLFSSLVLQPSSFKKALVACAACVLVALVLFKDIAKPREDDLPLPVAAAHEVVILHVDGADTGTIVVGELPVQGSLVLVGPGEVVFTSVQPSPWDNMVPKCHLGGPGAPIIWAQADPEVD